MKGISLRGLEVFEALARSGTVAQAALDTGLSQPAVSQQMRNLETALDVKLVDHARRPMRLTPAGKNFLRRATAALSELRLATAEVSVMDLAHLDTLSLGIADDFDAFLTPHLALILADSFEGSRYHLATQDSTRIAQMLEAGTLDLALTTGPASVRGDGLTSHSLAQEPLILVAPKDTDPDAASLLRGGTSVPFLRQIATQQQAHQVETYLQLQNSTLPSRFEIGSQRALMAMVARGLGWTITTPTGFMMVPDLHDRLIAQPLPGAGSAGFITLTVRATISDAATADIAQTLRGLIERRLIAPTVQQLPWLDGAFNLT